MQDRQGERHHLIGAALPAPHHGRWASPVPDHRGARRVGCAGGDHRSRFFDPGRSLAAKVAEAAERYRQRFGTTPNACLVNPDELSGDSSHKQGAGKELEGIRIRASKAILPHHLLIGIAAPTGATK
jgi:hypothetical protein